MKPRRYRILLTFVTTLLILLPLSPYAQETFKQYEGKSSKHEYFELSFDRRYVELSATDGDRFHNVRYQRDALRQEGKSLLAGDMVLCDSDGMHIDELVLPLDVITDLEVVAYDDYVTATFYTRDQNDRRLQRIRRGNHIRPFADISIDNDQFIRGLIYSLTGDIAIEGEVNKDVVTFLGDITVGPEAVVRGDIVSINGKVTVAGSASVYGEIFTGRNLGGRHHRRWSRRNEASFSMHFGYNRVDGATPVLDLRYKDRDSLLPTAWLSGGYAFASDRTRFGAGLQQTLLRHPAIALGGEVYRELASEDDWLLSNDENLIFALLATEDFKDYYETEGGRVFVTARPWPHLELDVTYHHDETNWLDAHPRLWSLFGGDKRFGANYGTVDSSFREAGKAELDTTTNAGMTFSVTFDTRDHESPFSASAWAVAGTLDWSHPDFDSDFDYRRYTLSVRRYQKIRRELMLLVRGTYGGSDGYLPMYKRFFIGGLGTLRGMKHKEFMGTRFWMGNVEYRFQPPRVGMAFSVLWDFARITGNNSFGTDDELMHSLGLAVYLGEDVRVTLARRLNKSTDTNLQLYVRLSHAF